MSDLENASETQQESECFARALTRALESEEVTAALDRFPQHSRPDLRSAVESERAYIWARVAGARRRVRELEAHRTAIQRRITEIDPGVAAASANVEKEYLRLANVWRTLAPEANRLGLEPEEFDPVTALADIRRGLDQAKSATPAASSEPPSADRGQPRSQNAGGVPKPASRRRRLQERLTWLQIASSALLVPAALLAVFFAPSALLLRLLGGGRDQKERVRRAVSGLQRDLVSLQASLRDQEVFISAASTLAATGTAEYGSLRTELEEAWQRLTEKLLNDGILDTLRRALNTRLEDLYTAHMPDIDAPALSEPLASDKPVTTPAIQAMRDLLNRMHGASIGVAGPRGAGKSTLIDVFCTSTAQQGPTPGAQQPKPWLGLRVSAPVDYEPRDFILYLFAELCRRVAGPWAESEIQPPQIAAGSDPRPVLRMCAAATALAGGIGVGWGVLLITASLRVHPSLVRPVSVFLGGILVLLAVATLNLRTAIARMAPSTDPKSYPWWYSRFDQITLRDRQAYSEKLIYMRRSQLRNRSFGLSTLFMGGALALLTDWVSPVHLSSYIVGAAAIAVSGPIGFTAISFQTVPEMTLERDPPTIIAEHYRSGRDLRRMMGVLITEVAVASFAFGIIAISFSFVPSTWSLSLMGSLLVVLVGGLMLCAPLALVGSRLYSAWPSSVDYRAWEDQGSRERLVELAMDSLIAIRFQQTISSDWSGTISLGGGNIPVGLQSQWTQGASWARQPQTYPELVGRFREFATSITQRYRVVIGIDELDKLESGVKAERFLNDIKGIFGIRECYFLVSVSEDAAASFDRRGLPFRDVFDTCFDSVITVSYLNHAAAKQLLYGRVIGWPMPFIALCHVLSGGLARDLVRIARTVIRGPQPEVLLAETAQRLCMEEARARTHGLQHQLIRSVGDGPSDELLGLLAEMPNEPNDTADALTFMNRSKRLESWAADPPAAKAVHDAGQSTAAEPIACRWARDLSALYFFLATVLEFFTDDLPRSHLETAENPTQGKRSLDHLAAARQQMSVNVRVAVRYIEDFRIAWNLGPDSAEIPPQPGPEKATTTKRVKATGQQGGAEGLGTAEPHVPAGLTRDRDG